MYIYQNRILKRSLLLYFFCQMHSLRVRDISVLKISKKLKNLINGELDQISAWNKTYLKFDFLSDMCYQI